jgi:tRNA pseudouridine38-40 synthase
MTSEIAQPNSLKKIKMLVSYDGTNYCGWQKQKEHKHGPTKPSLQETMEKALSQLFNEPIGVNASGRTDAGVHAVGQVCDFETSRPLPRDFCWAVKSLLPETFVVKAAWEAPKEFHSTLSAVKKTYKYWVWNRPRPTALLAQRTHWVRKPLNLDRLNQMAKLLEGEKDFKSFQSVGTPVAHTVRTIYSARWHERAPGLIEFEVTGSGFLKQMVRNLVGTQLDLETKEQPIEKIEEILAQKDRRKAGRTAPAQGLYLWKVYYPKALDIKCRRI